MKTICSCGYDCSDFIVHHTIPAGAQFGCPRCESAVLTAEEIADVAMANLSDSEGPLASAPAA